jgi:hypothetical protein
VGTGPNLSGFPTNQEFAGVRVIVGTLRVSLRNILRMRRGQREVVFIVVLTALGYIGAGLFYGYLLGFDTQTPLTCPVCPNISSSGIPLQKFLVRTIVLGTLNALFFLFVAWILRGLIAVTGKIWRSARTER